MLDFVSWLKEHGGVGTSIKFKEYTETMRGVYSCEYIPSGTSVITIPDNMIIHSNMVQKKSNTIKKLKKLNINFISPSHVYITIYIIETFNDPTHFFYPYYKIFPKNLNNIPLFWTDLELSELAGSHFQKLINNKITKLRNEYNKIVRTIPYFKNMANFNKYKYIRLLVASRNFTLKINDERVNAMVPWADMLNHRYPPQTKWGYRDGHFFLDAVEDIDANIEIMDSYGLKTNALYLLHYGFTVGLNGKCSKGSIPIIINAREITLSIPINNYTLQDLLNTFHKHNVTPNYKNTDKKNLYTINKHLISLLDKYKTTYKEDIILINSKTIDTFSNKYNAMVVIANEKKIIQHYIEGIFKILEYIDLEPAQRILDEAYLIDYFNLRK